MFGSCKFLTWESFRLGLGCYRYTRGGFTVSAPRVFVGAFETSGPTPITDTWARYHICCYLYAHLLSGASHKLDEAGPILYETALRPVT